MYKEEKKQKVTEEQFQLVVPKHGNQLSASVRKKTGTSAEQRGGRHLTW